MRIANHLALSTATRRIPVAMNELPDATEFSGVSQRPRGGIIRRPDRLWNPSQMWSADTSIIQIA